MITFALCEPAILTKNWEWIKLFLTIMMMFIALCEDFCASKIGQLPAMFRYHTVVCRQRNNTIWNVTPYDDHSYIIVRSPLVSSTEGSHTFPRLPRACNSAWKPCKRQRSASVAPSRPWLFPSTITIHTKQELPSWTGWWWCCCKKGTMIFVTRMMLGFSHVVALKTKGILRTAAVAQYGRHTSADKSCERKKYRGVGLTNTEARNRAEYPA